MSEQTYFHLCTIQRTFVRSTGILSGGEFVEVKKETVTEPCGTPLFSPKQQATGICGSCRKGWEVENNKFATEVEKQRATEAGD